MASSALLAILFLANSPCRLQARPSEEQSRWWAAEVEQALGRAGSNRAQLEKALQATSEEQRRGMAFLLANMPDKDLKALRAGFLLEEVALAYQARRQVPWGKGLPEEIFLNDVLPYANVDEARHPWRKDLYELCLPLVKECKTSSEAAERLNSAVFSKLHVKFSTGRKKPQQSPKETIEQGLATCTGLSILLSDACRSVAVPARLAGTALWTNQRGNHTWVEVWDGDWHFTGAAEPDPNGLDRAWFIHDASTARKDSRLHAIYATSFRKTGETFPLVWNADGKDVYAVNVTDRYAKPLPAKELEQLEQAARAYFLAGAVQRTGLRFDAALLSHEDAVREVVWKAFKSAPIHEILKGDFDKHQVRHEQYLSPYVVKKVGQKPPQGWPLFIALHGGGNAPKEVNDSQWKVMQFYYRDQAAVGGYQYLALRAPNDTWNGFYADYVPPLILNLIRQFVLFGEVDPNKVFLMGYSHGGYGSFFIGPKIPDRFAAIHSSAAAPTDGEISPKTLRNTHFTYMVGDSDNDYGRRQRCETFNEAIQKLKEKSKEDYPVELELKKGFGHRGLPDRDKIRELYAFTRNPVPRRVTWELTDPVVSHFFWLSVPKPGKGQSLDALIRDNKIEITTRGVEEFDLELDGRLVQWGRPLQIVVDGKPQAAVSQPRFGDLCQSLLERGDPYLAFTCRIRLKAGK